MNGSSVSESAAHIADLAPGIVERGNSVPRILASFDLQRLIFEFERRLRCESETLRVCT